jgi:zinc transporter ZupT
MIEYLNITAGLILCIGIIEAIPAMRKYLKKLTKWLGAFEIIIGLIVIFAGIYYWSFPWALITIFAGLILTIGILPAVPSIGTPIEKFAKMLGGFQTIIGLIVLIFGVLDVLGYLT